MVIGREYGPMNKEEIAELLQSRGWSRSTLARKLHVIENTVQRWFMRGEAPDGPASELMRLWLLESRGEISIVEHEPPNANGHKKPGKNGHRKELAAR